MPEFKSRREARKLGFSWFHCWDPGVGYAGFASFSERLLAAAHLDNSAAVCAYGHMVGIVEAPEHTWKPEKDILRLARAAGEIGGRYSNRLYVTPAEWKGSVPKGIHQKQHILPRLTEAERALLPTKKGDLVHVLDAVGIGLWYLGRL